MTVPFKPRRPQCRVCSLCAGMSVPASFGGNRRVVFSVAEIRGSWKARAPRPGTSSTWMQRRATLDTLRLVATARELAVGPSKPVVHRSAACVRLSDSIFWLLQPAGHFSPSSDFLWSHQPVHFDRSREEAQLLHSQRSHGRCRHNQAEWN